MEVSKSIVRKMRRAVVLYQEACALMHEVDVYFDEQGVPPEFVRSGDGTSLEEIEYGNDVVDAFVEKMRGYKQ